MKTPTRLRPESVALEEAREALNPAEEICPPQPDERPTDRRFSMSMRLLCP
jgi:hypothetical protein